MNKVIATYAKAVVGKNTSTETRIFADYLRQASNRIHFRARFYFVVAAGPIFLRPYFFFFFFPPLRARECTIRLSFVKTFTKNREISEKCEKKTSRNEENGTCSKA
jgi:hypothetical protein